MLNTIRRRIAIPYVILIFIAMLGTGWLLTNYVQHTMETDLNQQIKAETALIAEAAQQFLLVGDTASLRENAIHWQSITDQRVTIIAPDGVVLADSQVDPAEMENHGTRPEVAAAIENGWGYSNRFSTTVASRFLFSAQRVDENGVILGVVRLALPLDRYQASLDYVRRSLMGTTLIAAVLAVLLALWIATDTSRPILLLTTAAEKIAHGETETEFPSSPLEETERLTHAFNTMTAKLQTQIQALENERSRLATILHEMNDGVVIIGDEGTIQMINPAAEEMFSVNRAETVGRSLAEGLRHHQLMELWELCRETGEAQHTVIELHTNQLYLQSVATPLGKAFPGNTLLLFQNLSHQRFLETVRRDFISNISHELRTPLASLKALTETLQESALEDPSAARRFLQKMESEVDALSQMVSELLELSRIESGRFPLQVRPISPNEVLCQAAERLRLQAERAGLQLNIDCPENLPNILGDPARLEQVVVNLLHNAIKFTPSGGRIELRARIADSAEFQALGLPHLEELPEKGVLFSVQDTGVGISLDDLPRIFERFYKTDRSRSGGGTGLGLAIARHTVEAHRGHIWAQSEEGRGSTFYFTLPLAGHSA